VLAHHRLLTRSYDNGGLTWLTTHLSDALTTWSDRARFGWDAFSARNMHLETRLAPDRCAEYLDYIREPHDQDAWKIRHRAFHLERIAMVGVPARRVLAKRDRDSWPSPFRWMAQPLKLGDEEYLVHVASAYSLSADSIGVTPEAVLAAARANDRELLDDILDNWWRRGSRSVFAALSDDVAHLVVAAETGTSGWADALSHRLGLAHYDPLSAPIDVVLLRYRVNDVPRVEGLREQRPIVAPTALDSSLNPAFCPFPAPDCEGRVVDLAGNLEPVREVIHPRPLLTAQNVVACGQITRSVPDLVFARWVHIEWIRERVRSPDFASETDSDLAA
jgi:hypothetical protein